jgi:hypothetical protein
MLALLEGLLEGEGEKIRFQVEFETMLLYAELAGGYFYIRKTDDDLYLVLRLTELELWSQHPRL